MCVCVCVWSHLCLKELDESGQVVLILAAVSFQVTLNDQVTRLAHFLLLTTVYGVEGREGEVGGEGKETGRRRRGEEEGWQVEYSTGGRMEEEG